MEAKKTTSADRMAKFRKLNEMRERNTRTLVETDGARLFYSNIDFLTIRLTDGSRVVNTLRGLVENSPNLSLDNGLFKVQYEGMVMGGQMTVLRMYDKSGNKVGAVHLKNDAYQVVIPDKFDEETGDLVEKGYIRKANNKNVCTNLELTGDFWKMYSEYFPEIARFFEIDLDRPKNVTRLDFCADIVGLDTDSAFKRFRMPFEEGDGNKGSAFYVGNVMAGWTDKNDRCEMAIYNKKLDVVEKSKHKLHSFDGAIPYLPYVREEAAITRFEVRFSSRLLREAGASVNWCMKFGRQMFVDYVKKYYLLNLDEFFGNFERLGIPKRKEDKFMSQIVGKKAKMAKNLMVAYANNLRDFKNEAYVFETLYQMYGDRLQEWLFRHHPRDLNEWEKIF